MMEIKRQIEDEEEVRLLREWLPRIKEEERAFIKGATKALLYAQESQTLPSDLKEGNGEA